MAERMSIRRYLKPIDGLPDPKGSLSTTIPSATIASANREDRHLAEFGGHTVQRIDVVTFHTTNHRPLFQPDGMITPCAYYLWCVYNYISRKIIFVNIFIRKKNLIHKYIFHENIIDEILRITV